MRTKVLTKDCPSCKDLTIGEDTNFHCNWGSSECPKILKEHRGKRSVPTCKLINKNR